MIANGIGKGCRESVWRVRGRGREQQQRSSSHPHPILEQRLLLLDLGNIGLCRLALRICQAGKRFVLKV
jgi:hypothetical protein